jgi:hypothetical protein
MNGLVALNNTTMYVCQIDLLFTPELVKATDAREEEARQRCI